MLSENLTKYREQRGYSKLHLARVSGLSRMKIKQIESNENTNVTIATLEKLAKALSITIQDLLK